MLSTLIQKELRALLLSPKFVATFAVCSILILLSVFTGIRDYQAKVSQWEAGTQLADQQVRETSSWRNFNYKTLRKPDPMEIFVSGLTNDIGRWSQISSSEGVKLKHSIYSDDPIFAVFRFMDFTFIFQVVLSLFAILFTYDAVSGERENGTLKLVFSQSVPRATYLISKCCGAFLGLVGPLMIPILLGILLVQAFGINLSGADWSRLVSLIAVSAMFFTFFIVLGVLISSLTRRSSVSFLIALVIWITFILIIPRAGVMAANQFVQVPRVAEIEGRRDGYAKDRWKEHYTAMEERFRANREKNSEEDSQDDAEMWTHIQFEDSLRRAVEKNIAMYEKTLMDDLRLRKSRQERMAFTLSRFSPASAYQLSAMSLAGTGVELKSRYVNSMSDYRGLLNDYAQEKSSESNDMGGFISITMDSETGLKISTNPNKAAIDVSDMPSYMPSEITFAESFTPILPNVVILGLGILLSFMGAFVAFLRYDVR